jgi:hypothetical protein
VRSRPIVVVVFVALLAGLLAPSSTPARPIQVLGGLRLQHVLPGGVVEPLTPGDVTGLVVIMNPGIEKTMAQQMPPYMVPVFVKHTGRAQPGHPGGPDQYPRGVDHGPGHAPRPERRGDGRPDPHASRPGYAVLLRLHLGALVGLRRQREEPEVSPPSGYPGAIEPGGRPSPSSVPPSWPADHRRPLRPRAPPDKVECRPWPVACDAWYPAFAAQGRPPPALRRSSWGSE